MVQLSTGDMAGAAKKADRMGNMLPSQWPAAIWVTDEIVIGLIRENSKTRPTHGGFNL